MRRFWDIRLQKCSDLENRARGPSRSLKISPFDRDPRTSYFYGNYIQLDLMSFLGYSMSKNIATLKSRSRVSQGHWNWYHSIDCVFYSNFVPLPFRDNRHQICHDLENQVRVRQGHWKCHHSIEHLWLIIKVQYQSWAYLVPFRRQTVISVENRKFFQPLVFCAPAERVPLELGIGAWGQKTSHGGCRAENEVWLYLQPSGYNTPTWQTDGRMDYHRATAKTALTHSVAQ